MVGFDLKHRGVEAVNIHHPNCQLFTTSLAKAGGATVPHFGTPIAFICHFRSLVH